jgi:hypothetical protein
LQVVGVEPVLPAQLKHALHRSRDVLMQTVGKLDDDDGALARRPQKTADDSTPGLTAYFAKDDFHASKLA